MELRTARSRRSLSMIKTDLIKTRMALTKIKHYHNLKWIDLRQQSHRIKDSWTLPTRKKTISSVPQTNNRELRPWSNILAKRIMSSLLKARKSCTGITSARTSTPRIVSLKRSLISARRSLTGISTWDHTSSNIPTPSWRPRNFLSASSYSATCTFEHSLSTTLTLAGQSLVWLELTSFHSCHCESKYFHQTNFTLRSTKYAY